MGHFSMEKSLNPGSVLGGNQQAAVLLRGFGLGFLFLSITLIAFSDLDSRSLPSGIGLFNTGRQLGGLMGVAGLQTLIDNNVASNVAVLGANVNAGDPAVSERLTTMTAMLVARGMDAVAASRAAASLLGRVIAGQSTVIAFDTAFNAVALLFVVAAPVLVTIKIGVVRYAKARAVRSSLMLAAASVQHASTLDWAPGRQSQSLIASKALIDRQRQVAVDPRVAQSHRYFGKR